MPNYIKTSSIFTDQSFWFTIRLLTAPWEWMLDYSTKANTSFLTQTSSQLYVITKAQIEKAVRGFPLMTSRSLKVGSRCTGENR